MADASNSSDNEIATSTDESFTTKCSEGTVLEGTFLLREFLLEDSWNPTMILPNILA
jgi:hypothetical protein